MAQKAKLGFLLSGGGRTLDNLFQKIDAKEIPAEISLVISSHRDAGGLKKAQSRSIPAFLVDYKEVPEPEFSQRISQLLRDHQVDFVLMGGFIRHWKISKEFENKVLNIHPALLPKYGGKGMYGHHVHEAVWKAKEKESGCTVHWVNHDYDRGPIVLQRRIALSAQDTPESIAEKVFAEECLAYPEAILQLLKTLPKKEK